MPKLFSRKYKGKKIRGEIHQGDALEFLESIESEQADLVFLDPPFNLGKSYSDDNRAIDKRPEAEYEKWLIKILDESVRILKNGGALYLYHLPVWAMRLGVHLQATLVFRHWIAVAMKNGFVRGKRLYPAHYSLLYFTKGDPGCFTRPKLNTEKCRHCGKLVKDYGGYREIIEKNGVNLSDFWDDLSPVRHKNRKNRLQNELPSTFMQRVIEISGSPKLLYVDPFVGSGSGVIAAVKSGLQFQACDIIEANCELVAERLDAYKKTFKTSRVLT